MCPEERQGTCLVWTVESTDDRLREWRKFGTELKIVTQMNSNETPKRIFNGWGV